MTTRPIDPGALPARCPQTHETTDPSREGLGEQPAEQPEEGLGEQPAAMGRGRAMRTAVRAEAFTNSGDTLSSARVPVNVNTARVPVNVYTDGGCPVPQRRMAYAFIAKRPDGTELRRQVRTSPVGTNNQAEVMAVLLGVEALPNPCAVTVYTDSKNAIGWITGAFKCNDPTLRSICERIDRAVQAGGHTLTFEWVRGHAGHPENEECDAMCTGAIRRANMAATMDAQRGRK